jgi:hypothetical protein
MAADAVYETDLRWLVDCDAAALDDVRRGIRAVLIQMLES